MGLFCEVFTQKSVLRYLFKRSHHFSHRMISRPLCWWNPAACWTTDHHCKYTHINREYNELKTEKHTHCFTLLSCGILFEIFYLKYLYKSLDNHLSNLHIFSLKRRMCFWWVSSWYVAEIFKGLILSTIKPFKKDIPRCPSHQWVLPTLSGVKVHLPAVSFVWAWLHGVPRRHVNASVPLCYVFLGNTRQWRYILLKNMFSSELICTKNLFTTITHAQVWVLTFLFFSSWCIAGSLWGGGRKGRATLPLSQNFFICMQFSGKKLVK